MKVSISIFDKNPFDTGTPSKDQVKLAAQQPPIELSRPALPALSRESSKDPKAWSTWMRYLWGALNFKVDGSLLETRADAQLQLGETGLSITQIFHSASDKVNSDGG